MSALPPSLLPVARPLRVGIVAILLLATALAMAAMAGAMLLGASPATDAPARLIVQVGGATPAARRIARDRVVSLLAARADVREARLLPPRELARLMAVDPADLEAAQLPLPSLIEVRLAHGAHRGALDQALASIGGVQIVGAAPADDGSARRLHRAMLGLVVLAVALAGLGAALAARAERMTARQDLALLRDLGATLRQRADAIGRPLMRDIAIGVVGAAILAPLALLWLGLRIGAGGWLGVMLVAPSILIVAAGAGYLALMAGSGREA